MITRFHFDFVQHEVKVTYLGRGKYGCRVLTNGVVSQECVVYGREAIGPACRDMLRMEQKCGNLSAYASNSRHRLTKKELARGNRV